MSVLGLYTAGKEAPYIHLKWNADERGQVALPNAYDVYRYQKNKFKNTIQKTFTFTETKYNNVFELLDEISTGLNDSGILEKARQGIHTSGEKVNLFTAEGGITSKSLEQLRYYKTNTDLLTRIDGELKNLQIYIDTLENILDDSQIYFNSQMISDVVDEILAQQAMANKIGEKLSTQTMNALITNALDTYQGKFLKHSSSNKLANYERFAAQLEIYKQTIARLGQGSLHGTDKRLIQNIAYQIGISVSRLGGFLYEPAVAEAINEIQYLADYEILNHLKAVAGLSATKASVKASKAKMQSLKTKKVVKTEDIQFSFVHGDKSIESNLSVQLPGASLKAITYNPKKNFQEVHIQTGTTIGDVITRSNINVKQKYAIANSLVHDGANSKMGKAARDFLAAKNILNALSGTLTQGDASYFLIVNQKAFTVPQILEECAKSSGLISVKVAFKGISGIKGINDKYEAIGISPQEAAINRSIQTWSVLKNVYMNTSLLIGNQLFGA